MMGSVVMILSKSIVSMLILVLVDFGNTKKWTNKQIFDISSSERPLRNFHVGEDYDA